MKLDKYKHVEETDSHFIIDDGEGKIRVPKNNLRHSTVLKIQQHFAKGGEAGYPNPDAKENPQEPPDESNAWVSDYATPSDPGPFSAAASAIGSAMDRINPNPGAAPSQPATQGPGMLERPPEVAPPQPAQPMQQEQPQPQGTGLNTVGDIRGGVRQEQAAVQQEAASKQRWGNEMGAMSQQEAQWQAQAGQRMQDMLTQRSAEWDKKYQDVASAKVDPNHFWATRTTGDKIAASIGMILGGMGAGLTGGPNHAAQIIDKAIDRDIESQKFNIQKGQNDLAHYMQQTGNLVSAQQLLKASHLTVAAGMMDAAKFQAGASAAQPEADRISAGMRVQAAQLTQQATAGQLQIEQGQMGLRYQRAQMELLGNVMRQGGQGAGNGITIPPGAEMLLPKEMQETLVRLPNGKVDFAHTPDDAKEVKKTQEATVILRQKLQRYAALQQAHPNGISEVMSPGDYNAAQALHESILTDLNGLAGLQRFSHEEAQVFGGRIPQIWKLSRSSASTSKLGELGQEIDDKVQATNRTHLRFLGGR